MSSWVEHVIWWHVYPLGALAAPIHTREEGLQHRLRRLDPWLDHAVALGCSGVLLGPVFASTSHGYDTVDHYRIDPRLGDDAEPPAETPDTDAEPEPARKRKSAA